MRNVLAWARAAAAVACLAGVCAAPVGWALGASPSAIPGLAAGVLVNTPLPAKYTAPLCGSRLLPCGTVSLGRDATTEPTPRRMGAFTEVSLTRFYDTAEGAEAAVPLGGPPPKYTPAGWGAAGINGTPYVAQMFPSTGNWTVQIHGLPVTFLIPALGVGIRSTFDLANPVTIPVPPGRYRAVWILGNGIGGGAGDVLLNAVYRGGTTHPYVFNFTEWCSPGQLAPGEFPAEVMPNLQQASAGKMVTAYSGCGGLYAVAVPIDSARTLTALSIPGSIVSLLSGVAGGAQNDFIVAVSLQS